MCVVCVVDVFLCGLCLYVCCLLVLLAVSFAMKKAFYLDEVLMVYFCLCFPCLWRRVLQEVAVAKVKEVAACVLLLRF